jgi:hypothetical protein
MRIVVLHRPARAAVDGIDLKHFVPGQSYDVGTSLGMLMLAEGWAAPVDTTAPVDSAVPATAVVGGDPFTSRSAESHAPPARSAGSNSPPNLIRETHPPTADEITMAADFEPRKRRQRPERG